MEPDLKRFENNYKEKQVGTKAVIKASKNAIAISPHILLISFQF